VEHLTAPFSHAPVPAFAGLAAVILGGGVAWRLYRGALSDPLPGHLGRLSRWMRDRFYIDPLYDRVIAGTQDAMARVADVFDRWILAGGVVKGLHGTIGLWGRALRLVQTGSLQTYALLFAAGVVLVLALVLTR
jgi:NADH-quinone oxidoreductase subunit L